MTTTARRERHALCDTALDVGADAPTLCGDWDAAHLMAHLFVREQRPLGAVGIVVPPLAGLTDRAMEHALRGGYPSLVERVRQPRFAPMALGPLDALINTLEYLVHHEDLRRGRTGWEPRELPASDREAVWTALGRAGRMLVRGAGVPVLAESTDGGGPPRRLRGGAEPARVSGPTVEVTLWLYGRDDVRDVELTGPDGPVARLRASARGL